MAAVSAGTEVIFKAEKSFFRDSVYPHSHDQFVPPGNSGCITTSDRDFIPVSSGKLSPNQLYMLADRTTALYGGVKVSFFYCNQLSRVAGFDLGPTKDHPNGRYKRSQTITYFPISVSVPGFSRKEMEKALCITGIMTEVLSRVADYLAASPEEIRAWFLKDHASFYDSSLSISAAWGGGQISCTEESYEYVIDLPKVSKPAPNHKKKHKQQVKLAGATPLSS